MFDNKRNASILCLQLSTQHTNSWSRGGSINTLPLTRLGFIELGEFVVLCCDVNKIYIYFHLCLKWTLIFSGWLTGLNSILCLYRRLVILWLHVFPPSLFPPPPTFVLLLEDGLVKSCFKIYIRLLEVVEVVAIKVMFNYACDLFFWGRASYGLKRGVMPKSMVRNSGSIPGTTKVI